MERQSDSYRCQIVRQFLLTITDETTRLTCFLYMRGFQDSEILRALRIGKPRLKQIKDQLAFDLLKAGIRIKVPRAIEQESFPEKARESHPAENPGHCA